MESIITILVPQRVHYSFHIDFNADPVIIECAGSGIALRKGKYISYELNESSVGLYKCSIGTPLTISAVHTCF